MFNLWWRFLDEESVRTARTIPYSNSTVQDVVMRNKLGHFRGFLNFPQKSEKFYKFEIV